MPEEFARTSSGLSNMHLFFDVDIVLFCEGGQTFQDAMDAVNSGSDETLDAAYWRTVVRATSSKKYHVKSVGSRSTAEAIAKMACQSKANSILVTVDADLDHCTIRQGPSLPVVRSFSYSWESDLARSDVLSCVFVKLRGRSVRARAAMEELEDWYSDFFNSCSAYTLLDAKHVLMGHSGLYDRANPLTPLRIAPGNPPGINNQSIEARMQPDGFYPSQFAEPAVEACRDTFGKFALKATYHALLHFAGKVRKLRIDFETFVEIALSCLGEILRQPSDIGDYYRGRVA